MIILEIVCQYKREAQRERVGGEIEREIGKERKRSQHFGQLPFVKIEIINVGQNNERFLEKKNVEQHL